mmetsp:Transcript_89287/g.148370  ORF Transcript_89287/g.148370 Transcript_89287/m.148370 type:complete len:201 (+) Transcript_89287:742-1344(+)
MSQATSNSVASKFWNAGTLQIEAVKAPTNAKDMAENGAEAGSCCAMVAVPTPWALQPIAMPRAILPLILKMFRKISPTIDPTTPLNTAAATVRPGLPIAKALVASIARGAVAEWVSTENVRNLETPQWWHAAATLKIDTTAWLNVRNTKGAKYFSRISRFWKIPNAMETTAGLNRDTIASPAAKGTGNLTPVLKCFKLST